jgi:hypothetical protein
VSAARPADDGHVAARIEDDLDDTQQSLRDLHELDVDLDAVTAELERAGVASFGARTGASSPASANGPNTSASDPERRPRRAKTTLDERRSESR